MRWALTKRFWNLCKMAFPDKEFWVSVPVSIGKAGVLPVHEQGTNANLGQLKYDISSKYGKTIITASINGVYDEIAFKRRGSVTVKASKQKVSIKIADTSEPDEHFYESVANMYLESESNDLNGWLGSQGLQRHAEKVSEILSEQGIFASSTMEPVFHVNDRVRVNNPVSMEHNEMGTITGIRGDHENGWFYGVLVDGSSKPIWFPKALLKKNMAGVSPDE